MASRQNLKTTTMKREAVNETADEGLPVAASAPTKRRRRVLSIEEKIKLIDRLKAGERPLELSRKANVSESAIRALKRSEKQLREFAAQCTSDVYKSKAYIPRSLTLERAEQVLYYWYEQERAKGRTLTIVEICTKAREIYAELKETEAEAKKGTETETKQERNDEMEDLEDKPEADDDDEEGDEREFKASKGWFSKFRKRYNLDYRSIYETSPLDCAAAQKYPEHFKAIVRDEGFQPQQVFTVTQFPLAWKRMPECTTIAQRDQASTKIGHDRISLLFCGNAQGDFYVKPMLVYRTLTPFCLRMRKVEDLPVFWRARPRNSQCYPKVTPALFHEWLTECFTPIVRNYLNIMELPERCLLLIESEMLEQSHLPAYDDSLIHLEFLPAQTVPLLQPIALSVIPIFKCNYMQLLFSRLLSAFESEPHEQSLFKIWRNFTIAEAIDLIADAMDAVNGLWWNGGWETLWKEIVSEPFNITSTLTYKMQHIVDVARSLPGIGCSDMTIDDIRNHLKLETDSSAHQIKHGKRGTFDILLENDSNTDTDGEDNEHDYEKNDDDYAHETITINDNEEINFSDTDIEAPASTTSTREKNILRLKIEISKNCSKVQNINKAVVLSQQLIATLAEVSTDSQERLKFKNDLDALLQPYRELKERLLQPSIRDYFK